MIGDAALRAAAKLWYIKQYDNARAVPAPRDEQFVHSGAEDADRILLIGNGPAHGWGTVTHELALTGSLARSLQRSTGRPTDIDYVGDELMSLAAVIPWLGAKPVADFDLVLLVLSMNDAVRLTPVDDYLANMEALLDKLIAEIKPSARIVVAGISPVRAFPAFQGVFGALGQRNADRLNAAASALIGRYDGVEFMSLGAPPAEPGRPYGSPQLYAEWAEMFTTVCSDALNTARALEDERVPFVADPERQWDWEPGKRILDRAVSGGIVELDSLVDEAKRAFGVDVAFVSLVDGGRQYMAASTSHGPAGGVPVDITHCGVTIRGTEPVVVKNSFKDERFKDSPWIDVNRAQFYAGMPLVDADGEAVGTFCLLSGVPGSARSVSEADLRTFATRAQEELQRLAAEAPVAPTPHLLVPDPASTEALRPHGVED